MVTRHFTMISLGSVTAVLPDGQHVRQPLNFAFSGSVSTLQEDDAQQASIDALMAENAANLSQTFKARGAEVVHCDIRPVAQVL